MMSDRVGWLGGIIMSAAVISLYTVFSKKLKTVDCIMTAILTFAGWALSNGFAYLFQIFLKEQEAGNTVNINGILADLTNYSMKYTEITSNKKKHHKKNNPTHTNKKKKKHFISVLLSH